MHQIRLEEPGRFTCREIAPPTRAPGEAIVRVRRIGICGTDLHAFAGRQPFFSYPRVLGHELGVEVIDPGDDPHGLTAGDRCAVEPYLNCGRCDPCRRGRSNCCTRLRVLGVHLDGGMQPVIAVPSQKLHHENSLSFDQLALVETLAIGAHAVERAAVRPDDYVLVLGAGPIGLSVIQFVQAIGARLAVVDLSAVRRDFCRDQLGVAEPLDAAASDLVERVKSRGDGEPPTVVFDATGNARSMCAAFDWPAHGGRLVFVGLVQGELTFDDPNFHRRELTLLASRNALPATFQHVLSLVTQGKVDTSPWITHRLPLTALPGGFAAAARDPKLVKMMAATD